MARGTSRVVKYQYVKEELGSAITRGKYSLGDRLPSEKQLAEEFGVSIITIRQAVEALSRDGFVEKIQGSGTYVRHLHPMVDRKVWAYVVPDLSDPWYPRVVAGFAHVAEAAGAQVIVAELAQDEQSGESLRRLATMGVSGIALTPGLVRRPDAQVLQDLALAGIPLVFAGGFVEGVEAPRVLLDYACGGRSAAEHLLQLGHRRLAFFSHAPTSTTRMIWDGYLTALHRAGLAPWPPEGVYLNSWDPTELYRAARALLDLSPRPTAVFCSHDLVAEKVFQAARDAELRVPEDLSLVGFYNLWVPLDGKLTLTSVAYDCDAGGQAVGKLLLQLVMGGPVASEVILPCELVVRSTSGPAPAEES
jgi:GntR family transcriptional regulator of arabinose operon